MAVVRAIPQPEKAFQKQKGVSINRKSQIVRSIGLGFKTPKEAMQGAYVDKKCPFVGNVSIRGRILTGMVKSVAMRRSIVVQRDYLHYIPKYRRFEKRRKTLLAHCSPCFRLSVGDIVKIGQCRPLSKFIRFNVLSIERKATSDSKLKKF